MPLLVLELELELELVQELEPELEPELELVQALELERELLPLAWSLPHVLPHQLQPWHVLWLSSSPVADLVLRQMPMARSLPHCELAVLSSLCPHPC